MLSSHGMATSLVCCQVGRAAYSARGISSEASSRPWMPTTSIGHGDRSRAPAKPAVISDDQVNLVLRRTDPLPDQAEGAAAVIEERQADRSPTRTGCGE